jgi:hypothetical protein
VRRISLYLAFTSIVVLSFLLSIGGFAAEQKAPDTPKPAVPVTPPAPPPPADIPLADIAARATEVSNLLSSLTAAAAPSTQIETIAMTLPALSGKLDAQVATSSTATRFPPSASQQVKFLVIGESPERNDLIKTDRQR